MPIHDWSQVDGGTFHDFHNTWITFLKGHINRILPEPYYALSDHYAGVGIPDVLTLSAVRETSDWDDSSGSSTVAVLDAPPKTTTHLILGDTVEYSRRAKRIVIHSKRGDRVVAMIEIVSPGNKDAANRVSRFIEKALDAVWNGIHLMIIDLLPLGPHDPDGLHNEIWKQLGGKIAPNPAGRPLTISSFLAREPLSDVGGPEVFAEPLAVGMELPVMPLFLLDERYINVPLADSYHDAWQGTPAVLRPK